MRFGLTGSFGSARQMLDLAVEAEHAGWDGFFTWDGISEIEAFDPWSLLAAVAVSTSTIRLGATLLTLPLRRPWVVARQALTVDHLSEGRLVVQVGLGPFDDGGNSRVSGEISDPRRRVMELDDTLAILDLAWQGESFSYAGPEYQVHDLVLRPRPVQSPRIPIWLTASWPAPDSMGRAITWDGVLPSRLCDPIDPLAPAEIGELVAWVAERRPADAPTPFDVVVEGVLPDDPAAGCGHLRALADAGVTWWIESRWDVDRDTPDRLLELARRGPPSL
ncbi:LLM class flavin-dependent oxidoreductase [Georgenia sp. SYP-B2076]|uniref:LLM class flavin-dependent oxidoreductase n=1 Tax=Georgenia sp. SYP-B2076 TaxID=2495881 RepID=UPI000F8DEAB3|nr:LLM class flavin-dependent oxidoreductase [Georgenia sp. SYP-B2076]